MVTKRAWIVDDYPCQSYAITGENLVTAIEEHFNSVARRAVCGNAAGYRLISAKVIYDPYLFCQSFGDDGPTFASQNVIMSDKDREWDARKAEGYKLVIVAKGSDGLVNYNPDKDLPRTTVINIHGKKEDLPQGEYLFTVESEDSNNIHLL